MVCSFIYGLNLPMTLLFPELKLTALHSKSPIHRFAYLNTLQVLEGCQSLHFSAAIA